METVTARSSTVRQVHATIKARSSASLFEDRPFKVWRSSFCGLDLQKGFEFAGGFGEKDLRRELFRVRSESTGRQAATLAMQVRPAIGSPAVKAMKVVSAAQDSKDEHTHSKIRALIRRIGQVRDGWDGNANLGIQPSREVRERADGLLHRLVTLQHFAEQHTGPDGRVPVQVITTMKALSREVGSLENIVRLANDSGATVTRSKGRSTSHVPPSFPSKPALPTVAVKNHSTTQQEVKAQELQREGVDSGQGGDGRGSDWSTDRDIASVADPDYVVNAPAGKGPSSLSAFREEIERRVLEQLSSKLEQQVPEKVDRSLGTDTEAGALQSLLWTEHDNWAWSSESFLDTGLADRRKAEFDLGPPETPRVESSFSASTSGSDTWKHQQYVKGTEIVRQQKIKTMEDEIRTAESERLQMELHLMQAELQSAESSTARVRVKELEVKVRQLELDLSRSEPLDVHDQSVKKLHGTIAELRGRVRELEGCVRERESMITTVSNNLIAERDAVVKKLTAELAKRVPSEEIERAVTSAVDCVRAELSRAQQEVWQLATDLDQREEALAQAELAWEQEKRAVKHELDASIQRMMGVEAMADARRAEWVQEQLRAVESERMVTRLVEERDTIVAAAVAEKQALLQQVVLLEQSQGGGERLFRESPDPLSRPSTAAADLEVELLSARQAAARDQTRLERVRYELKRLKKVAEAGQIELLVKGVADLLVSISREESSKNEVGELGEVPPQAGGKLLQGGASSAGAGFMEEKRDVSVSERSASAAEGLTAGTGIAPLIRAADSDDEDYELDDEYETEEEDVAEVAEREAPALWEEESDFESKGDVREGVRFDETVLGVELETASTAGNGKLDHAPKVTLFYETGWDKAFVHCSIDGQSWTDPPGLPMVDGVGPKGQPVKMLELSATSLEFVVTNGADNWDKPVYGGNYCVDHAGAFTLSSGYISDC